jgi:hypothetical protein
MQTFYFHLRNGSDTLLDYEGRNLSGVGSVATIALLEARSIIGADGLDGKIALEQRIDVEDGWGAIVHTLQFEDAVHVSRGARL